MSASTQYYRSSGTPAPEAAAGAHLGAYSGSQSEGVPGGSDGEGLSAGTVAGITLSVVGAFVLLAIVAAILLDNRFSKRRRSHRMSAVDGADSQPSLESLRRQQTSLDFAPAGRQRHRTTRASDKTQALTSSPGTAALVSSLLTTESTEQLQESDASDEVPSTRDCPFLTADCPYLHPDATFLSNQTQDPLTRDKPFLPAY